MVLAPPAAALLALAAGLCLVVACVYAYARYRRASPSKGGHGRGHVVRRLIEQSTDVRVIDLTEEGAPAAAAAAAASARRPVMIVRSPRAYDRVLRAGELGLGEGYVEGDWTTPDLEATLRSLTRDRARLERGARAHSGVLVLATLASTARGAVLPNNTRESARRNVAHHYDIGNDLYERMLGPTMQYTCAYYHLPGLTLDQAQRAKMELVAKKLDQRPGMRVLDIGCGFGTLGYMLASEYGVHVLGVTLSREQVAYARAHSRHPRLEVRLQDYRDLDERQPFDRVYSIGMFEQVGRRNYREYYDKCHALLKPDGIMLLHTIGTPERHTVPEGDNTFIGKYVFPSGQLPHASSLTAGAYADRWHLEDWQNFGLSYAQTLRAWRRNLGAWQGLDGRRYDARFRRIWDYYLQGCAAMFAERQLYLWQVVYTRRDTLRADDTHHIRRCGGVQRQADAASRRDSFRDSLRDSFRPQ
jgi:cyclopropane-fatty-acyl-phospholipid synthase